MSADSIAISLLRRFSEKQLPKASDLEWLVSGDDVPQEVGWQKNYNYFTACIVKKLILNFVQNFVHHFLTLFVFVFVFVFYFYRAVVSANSFSFFVLQNICFERFCLHRLCLIAVLLCSVNKWWWWNQLNYAPGWLPCPRRLTFYLMFVCLSFCHSFCLSVCLLATSPKIYWLNRHWTRKYWLNFGIHPPVDPDTLIFWRILHHCALAHVSGELFLTILPEMYSREARCF